LSKKINKVGGEAGKFGIAGVTIAAPNDTEGFYIKKLGITAASQECMGTCLSHLDLNSFQQLEILDRKQFDGLTQKPTGSNIVQITFETSDLQALHTYLASLGIRCSEISKAGMDGAFKDCSFEICVASNTLDIKFS